jgi:hypothetical protein
VINFLVGLPALVLAISWCHVDADEQEYAMGKLMRLSLIFIFGLAFPIYILRTRGFVGFKTLGLALLFVAAMFACVFATGFVTGYIAYLFGAWEF